MTHAAPVGCQVILRPREVPTAGKGGGHLQSGSRAVKEEDRDAQKRRRIGGVVDEEAKIIQRNHVLSRAVSR